MSAPEHETAEPNPRRAQELYNEWGMLDYDARRITPELRVEWSVMTRLYNGHLAVDRKLSSDLESSYGKVGFEGAFKYWGDGRPSLDWHIGTPEDPEPVGRTDLSEIAILELGVECAKEAHGAFEDLELEPVPEAEVGDFSSWFGAVARNAETIDQLVKEQFPYLEGWQPGFRYLEACVRDTHRKIEPYPH